MDEGALIAVAAAVFAWAVFSEWLAARNITGPLVLVAAGFVLANADWGLVSVDLESASIHRIAELTLALLLFADASKVPVIAARAELWTTARLLGVGLPLAIVAGTGVALLVFPGMPFAVAALIGASLAPTDAALSAAVLSDERLPAGLRRVVNVESGLNDGIATPVVTACIGATATLLHVVHPAHDSGLRAVGSLVLGIGVGAGVGLAGGHLLVASHRRGWLQHGARRIATIWLPLAAFAVAAVSGGNPFVAAFIGGLVFGAVARDETAASVELTELTGALVSLVVWFVFGATFVLDVFAEVDGRAVLYAVASLTLVRMVPVVIALLGSGHDRATTLFIGWFGPRGLASVVFGLLALEELGAEDPQVELALHTIALTILLSVVTHGASARPLIARYLATRARDRPAA